MVFEQDGRLATSDKAEQQCKLTKILWLWSVIYAIRYSYLFQKMRGKFNSVCQMKILASNIIFLVIQDFLIVPTSRTNSDLV